MKEVRYPITDDHTWHFEKEDNPTGMQMKVWCVFNHTEIIVRLFNHAGPAHKAFSIKKGLPETLLTFLMRQKLIIHEDNWTFDSKKANEYSEQDEFEDKAKCLYFVWKVIDKLLKF